MGGIHRISPSPPPARAMCHGIQPGNPFLLLFGVARQYSSNRFRSPPLSRNDFIPLLFSSLAASSPASPPPCRSKSSRSTQDGNSVSSCGTHRGAPAPPTMTHRSGILRRFPAACISTCSQQTDSRSVLSRQRSQAAMDRKRRLGIPHDGTGDACAARRRRTSTWCSKDSTPTRKVYLNDKLILTADNMFREWRVNVKADLKAGANSLRVVFPSPIKIAAEIAANDPWQAQDPRRAQDLYPQGCL